MEPKINYPEAKLFEEPVTIKCNVNGRDLMAEILVEKDNPIQYGFIIKFSDGESVEATITEGGYWYVENKKYRPYIMAIDKNLCDFIAVKHTQWYKFEIVKEGHPTLAWVSVDPENKNEYSVNFEGDYQFHLIRTKTGWENKSVRIGAGPVDQFIVRQVIKELERNKL